MRIRPSLFRLSVGLSLALTFLGSSPAHAFSLLPSEMAETPFAEWETMRGDTLVIDTGANMGYLFHENGGFTSFVVATGQRRIVRYIGRTYKASTPNRFWTVKEKGIKGDRTTFGPQGLFLRLFYKGEETAYGIHTHRSIAKMLADADRYRSMGCVLVSQAVLDVIEATYEGNGQTLDVFTAATLGDGFVTYETLKKQIVSMK